MEKELIKELRQCGEALVRIAAVLEKGQKVPAKEPEAKKEKPLTLEAVRAVLAEKSRQGFTAEVRELLKKHGAEKLSAVKPEDYPVLMHEAEVLGHAG